MTVSPILGAQNLVHFAQAKSWAEDDCVAARSFCLLRFSFCGFVPLCLTKVLVCIREAVDDVPESFLRVGKKGAVVSKQQLGDEFLNGFRACKKTPKVDHTTVCSETGVDAVCRVLLPYGA